MEKEFIPYKQVLELKELGFIEPCLAYYDYYPPKPIKLRFYDDVYESYGEPAPIYQQAFRWFREKHNYCYFIRGNNYDGYNYNIDNLGVLSHKIEIENRLTWKTYEEAELECLKKLIEIVKKLTNDKR